VIRVVNINLEPHWKTHKDYIYIGRGSKYGNDATRLTIGKTKARVQVKTREESIEWYRRDLDKKMQSNPALLLTLVRELDNKILGCYCKPLSCHGDVLADLIDGGII
jgi:hypothetical protein